MVGTANVSIAHGLAIANIVNVSALIIRDDSARQDPIDIHISIGDVAGFCFVNGANIAVGRFGGEYFDHINWNDSPFNRGWITIWHKV